jgi:hypothetical protein
MQQMLADVTIPWGDWIASGLSAVQPLVTLALTGVATYVMAAYIPPWLRMFAGTAAQARVNQVLEKAVSSAIARTAGAVAGQTTTIPIASSILDKAVKYAVTQAPELIKPAAKNSLDNLNNMVLARMQEKGIVPPEFDHAAAKEATKDFDFEGTLDKALSGKS